MATTTYGTEYVQSSDLVSNWPGSSLNVANRIDDVSLIGNGVNNQTGTSYTLVLTDGGKLVTFSNAAAVALTVPTNASVAFPTGVRIKLTNKGAGLVTVAGAGGVTLNGNQLTIAQNRSAMLYKLDTNTWVMTADAADSGMVVVTASNFTTSSAVNVNNCFTSTYRHYRLGLWLTAVSADLSLFMRLRAAGTDNTSTSYRSQAIRQQSTSVAGEQDPFSSGNTQFGFFGTLESTVPTAHMAMADIMSPEATAWTTYALLANVYAPDLNSYNVIHSGAFKATTSFDGFSLITSTGTISGSLVVYGYRNS